MKCIRELIRRKEGAQKSAALTSRVREGGRYQPESGEQLRAQGRRVLSKGVEPRIIIRLLHVL